MGKKYRGVGTIRWLAKDGEDGKPGKDGLPGQVPIQKEWVKGDLHQSTDKIIDYIYVRGVDKSTSYWYKLASKGTITAGVAPVGGATPVGYERIDWLKELAVKVLLAEEANLAGFIFKDNKLISQRGTVGGVAAYYSGQAGFVPNLILDGTEGDVKITGEVSAISGMIGSMLIKDNKIVSKDGRIEIDGDGSRIILKDSNSAVKTVIHPDSIKPLADYFDAGAGSKTVDLSNINSISFTGERGGSITIGGSPQDLYDLTLSGFILEAHVAMTPNGDADDKVEVGTWADLRKDGVHYADLISANKTFYRDMGGGSVLQGMNERTFSVPGGSTYTLFINHSINKQEDPYATSFGSVSGLGFFTTGKIINRSEIGNNGMVIATSPQNYTYDVGEKLEVRRGNIGFKVSSSGVQKSSNMASPTPTWTNI